MDATISYDEVAALVGVNIPTLEPCPNFERICTLRQHFERTLQRLACPQRVQHGWKGMVMARKIIHAPHHPTIPPPHRPKSDSDIHPQSDSWATSQQRPIDKDRTGFH
jgi:hypothetical protein